MDILFIVINHEKHFDKLLDEFRKNNIMGGTILESQGMAASMAEHNEDMGMHYFRMMMNEGRPYNKTVFLIGDDKKLELAKECVRKVVGDISSENVGIMFTIPLKSYEGLTK